jgi:hypothetical protein
MQLAERLYDHLIKPLSVGRSTRKSAEAGQVPFTLAPGMMSETLELNGQEHLEGLNLSFAWGVHSGLGEWYPDRDLHVHPYPECHMFVGLDTANVKYLGAQIECCLGEELETYTFDEPTVVVIPAGLPHGPVTTKRIFSNKGFGFYLTALSSTLQTERLERPAKAAPSGGKYAHLVKPLKSGLVIERGKFNPTRYTEEGSARRGETGDSNGMTLGPGNADHLTWMFGEDLEGLNVNMDWGFFSKPGLWHRGVSGHVHPTDEVLVYVGTDTTNIGFLGAEIEIDIGKEHERHLINKPSVVICPAGLEHAPIVTHWIERPFAFFSINLSGKPNMTFT